MTAAPHRATVIVCTWNRAHLLASCLDALARQTADPELWDVVVADDGSTDDTARVVDTQASGFPVPVRHLALPHAGLNAARNAGVTASSGDVVIFVDDDEIPPPTHVESVLDHFTDDPDLDGVGGPLVHDQDTVHRTCANCSFDVRVHDGSDRRMVNKLVGGNMSIRKRCFDPRSFGPFDQQLSGRGDEREWFHRAQSGRFLFDPNLVIRHRRTNFTLATTMRTAFRQGRAYPLYRELVNQPYRPRLRLAWRHLRHAAGRRCTYGLVRASREIGAWTEVATARLRSPLTGAVRPRRPARPESTTSAQETRRPD